MESIDLRDYILPLRRWWWLLLASTAVATVSSLFVTQLQPLQYQSRATVMVGASIRDPNPDGGEMYLAQQLVNTYVDLVQREGVRGPAMEALGLTWLPQYTARQVPNTQLMELTVLDTDPVRAQAVTQALVDQLIQISPAGAEEQGRAQFIETELDSLQSAITETKAEIERRQAELADMFSARQIADAQAQIGALENKLGSLQSNFTALMSTTQKGAVNALTVIEPPSPGAAVDRGLLFKLLTAAAIGFLLAAGGAYLIEYLDNSFKNSDEVQQKLGLPTLGAIPVLEGKDRDRQLVMLGESHSSAAEAFRVLRTNLQFSAVAHPIHSVVVTSPLPSEGKSVISANLAVAAAQAGNRVVLIDCDLHRPRQHKIFGLVNNVGVTSALLAADAAAPEQFLQGTTLPTLRVLTSGPLPPNAAELVGSQRMHELLTRLQANADILILDSPPASVLADTAVLSSQVDGLLLVLEVGNTNREIAKRTVAALQQVNAHILGTVLNRMPTRGGGYYYYHYYNYDYAKKYYRRKEKLVGGAIPPVKPAISSNGKDAPAPVPERESTPERRR